jgi:hypothetical protein
MTLDLGHLPVVELRPGVARLPDPIEHACRVGLAAAQLLHEVAIQTLPLSELPERLRGLQAGPLLADLWPLLAETSQGIEAFTILQLIDSLASDLDHQFSNYGFTSLMEDHKELLETLRRLGVYA